MKSLFFAILIFAVGPLVSAQSIQEAQQFLDENRVYKADIEKSGDYESLHRQIAATEDPKSKFGYIVFSVARHQKKLLTEDQSRTVDGLIDARQKNPLNWHDLRNIVRVHAVMELWDFATSEDKNSAEKYRKSWDQWTDLRIDYMFEEFVDKERFQRAVWEVLTSEQRAKLLSGEWDEYLKKSTGHGRLYSAPKQVTRALGKPENPEAFETAAKKWEERWTPMLEKYQAASKFQQQREFSMDLADEKFAVASWQKYAEEFREFITMERDAIRELVQVGYAPGVELNDKVAGTQAQLRAQMIEKYSDKAGSFLKLLNVK